MVDCRDDVAVTGEVLRPRRVLSLDPMMVGRVSASWSENALTCWEYWSHLGTDLHHHDGHLVDATCHTPRATSAVFDDPNLVSSAGLVPVLTLARAAGLQELTHAQFSRAIKLSVLGRASTPKGVRAHKRHSGRKAAPYLGVRHHGWAG